MKILFIDTETGGVNPQTSALIQLSGIIRIDKEDVEEFNFFIKPFPGSEVSEEALRVQGRTKEELETEKYKSEKEIYMEIKMLLDKYVDKYDKTDKFMVAGYNVRFDIDMLQAFFKRNKDNYLFSYLSSNQIDPLPCIGLLQLCDKLPVLENNKLETWCKHFGIELKAHDSLEDIKATKELIFKVAKLIRE